VPGIPLLISTWSGWGQVALTKVMNCGGSSGSGRANCQAERCALSWHHVLLLPHPGRGSVQRPGRPAPHLPQPGVLPRPVALVQRARRQLAARELLLVPVEAPAHGQQRRALRQAGSAGAGSPAWDWAASAGQGTRPPNQGPLLPAKVRHDAVAHGHHRERPAGVQLVHDAAHLLEVEHRVRPVQEVGVPEAQLMCGFVE
jgi:hypothetical protein